MRRPINIFRITILTIFLILLLSGCVSKSDYNELLNQIETLTSENNILTDERDTLSAKVESLKNELEDIKNGPINLLSQSKKYFEEENYPKVIELTSILHDKFNGVAEDVEGQKLSKDAQKKLDEAALLKKQEEERLAQEAKKVLKIRLERSFV